MNIGTGTNDPKPMEKYALPTNREDCGHDIIAPDIPCATLNVGVKTIDALIYRVINEVVQNVSSRVMAFSADDLSRIEAYFAELESVINTVSGSMVDWHGIVKWPLTDLNTVVSNVENETVNAAVGYLITANLNMRASQSTRLNDGFLAPEVADLKAGIAKAKAMIDAFVETSNPVDMPQSNPREPVIEST